MAGISIGLNVDAKQVTAARRETSLLTNELATLGTKSSIAGDNDLLRKVKADIDKLRGLDLTASAKGGSLNAKQLGEVVTVTRRLRDEFASWRGEIDKAKSALKALGDEQKGLDRELRTGATGKRGGEILDRMSDIETERAAAQRRLDEARKGDRRMSELQGKARGYSESLSNVDAQQEPGKGSSFGSNIKKALTYGGALLGGFSVMSFLQDSMAKAAAMDAVKTDLGQRGGNYGFGGATGLGYSPLEEAAVADRLSRSTGWRGDALKTGNDTALKFGRTFGIDAEAAAQFMGSTRTATGISAGEYKRYMASINTLAHTKVEAGRVEEFLDINKQLLTTISGASGGGSVGKDTADFVAGLQASLWKHGGVGQNTGIIGSLSSGIASGGDSPGQQLFLWNAFGGEKAKDLRGYVEIRKQMEQGASPENVRRVLLRMKDIGLGQDDAMMMAGIKSLSATMTYTQADTFWETIKEKAQSHSGGVDSLLRDEKAWQRAFSATETSLDATAKAGAGESRVTSAMVDEMKINSIGAPLITYTTAVKQGLVDAANSINKGELVKAIGGLTNIMSGDPLGRYGKPDTRTPAEKVSGGVMKMFGLPDLTDPTSANPWSIQSKENQRVHDNTHRVNEGRRKAGKPEFLHDEDTGELIYDEKTKKPKLMSAAESNRLADEIANLVNFLRISYSHA
jgi:hypothetical protein